MRSSLSSSRRHISLSSERREEEEEEEEGREEGAAIPPDVGLAVGGSSLQFSFAGSVMVRAGID